jgi:hypothetical protein
MPKALKRLVLLTNGVVSQLTEILLASIYVDINSFTAGLLHRLNKKSQHKPFQDKMT